VAQEEPRIGVNVCKCGSNIAGTLDCESLAEWAKTLPGVVCTDSFLYSCSADGLEKLKALIKEHNLNRIVVCSCTPRTHEPLFRSTCAEAGLNPFLYEQVNIREHCSWCHKEEPAKAMERAKDQIAMGVARAALLEPQIEPEVDVEPAALVIGGGVAGMSASLRLANMGFPVTLVEREKEFGGLVKRLHKLYPTFEDAGKFVEGIVKKVQEHKKITALTSAQLKSLKGYIGNYVAAISQGGKESEIKVGVVIVATGARVLEPEGLYGYDGKKVITQLQFEDLLKKGKLKKKNVVMLQCVGCRNQERVYCSRVCCMTAIKNAIIARETGAAGSVHILYRDLMTYGEDYEEILRKSKEQGIRYINYDVDNPPEVGDKAVSIYHNLMGRKLELPFDYLVLATPLVAYEDSEKLAQELKVPRDENGFFLEAHVKLRPVDFATDGIYVCGSAHWPKDVPESISQAYAAASRAAIPMAKGKIKVEPITSSVDEEKCIGCALCANNCPYSAIEMTEEGKARTIEASCKGCGLCAASCPQQAISMRHYTNAQLEAAMAVLSR
jgi:heterodisulfide reductase subunit A